MKTLNKSAVLLAILIISAAQTSFAGEWSIGVFASQANTDLLDDVCTDVDPIISCNANDSDSAMGINVAYKYNKYYGVEAGFVDFGKYTFSLSAFGESESVTLTSDTPYLAAVASLPLTDKFSISGRLGVFEASATVSSTISSSESFEADSQTYAGVSLNYSFSESINAQLRYDNFDEFELFGLGLNYNF